VVFNPSTPVEHVEWILEDVDLLLVMTVNPGFSGQKFIPQAAQKIRLLRSVLDQIQRSAVEIEVDGGITAETLPLVKPLGANIFVASTAIFRHPGGIPAGLAALKSAL